MKNSEDMHPKKVLGVAAHPDDLDFGASGSFAKWAKEGADIYYLIITDGSKGSDDESITSDQLVKIRKNEQRKAAKIVGAKDVFFLNYPDAYLEVTINLKRDITRKIRLLKPDLVITTDPTFLYSSERGFINHSDHRVAGQATIDSVFPMARDRLTFPELISEGLMPHKVASLLLINFEDGNYFVDITHTLDKKLEALAAHASQMTELTLTQDRMKDYASRIGKKCGVDYAECFARINIS